MVIKSLFLGHITSVNPGAMEVKFPNWALAKYLDVKDAARAPLLSLTSKIWSTW